MTGRAIIQLTPGGENSIGEFTFLKSFAGVFYETERVGFPSRFKDQFMIRF